MNTTLILLWLMTAFTLQAQDTIAERELILTAVNEYVEGRNNGDVERLRNAFLPNATLKGISRNKEQVITPLADYVSKQTPGRKHNCATEIKFIDFINDIAIAQVVLTYTTHTYFDYLILMKVHGQWIIADKIYTRIEADNKTP
jgi:hypothetical protein